VTIGTRALVATVGLAAALVAAASGGTGAATFADRPVLSWVTDGGVQSIVAVGDEVLVAGEFSLIGRPTGAWAKVDATGRAVPGWVTVHGAVADAVPDGRGGWFLAGQLDSVGAVDVSGIAHLRANGTLDRTWRPRIAGIVSTLVRSDETLYLGGVFTRAGQRDVRLAAIDIATGALRPWRPRPTVAKPDEEELYVADLAMSGDGRTVYIGGAFTRVGRAPRRGLAAVDAVTGGATTWRANVDGSVGTLIVSGGRVYASGEFTKVAGVARDGLAAIRTADGVVTDWNPRCDGSVAAMAVRGTTVYLGGRFAAIGDRSRRGLAAVDTRRGALRPFAPNVGGFVSALSLPPDGRSILAGGGFADVDGEARANLAAIDTRTGRPLAWAPRTIGEVAVVAPGSRGSMFVGGSITSVGADARTGLAALSGDGRRLLPWSPAVGGAVRALAASPDGGRVYVGGRFTIGDSRTSVSLATLDRVTGTLTPWGGTFNSGIWESNRPQTAPPCTSQERSPLSTGARGGVSRRSTRRRARSPPGTRARTRS
jgi:DNA-binding beta-propeller fold protein YncE